MTLPRANLLHPYYGLTRSFGALWWLPRASNIAANQPGRGPQQGNYMNVTELLMQMALDRGMEFNTFLESQVYDSVCDAGCLHCGHIEADYLEPDGRDVICPECDTPNLFASVELALEIL